MRLVLAAAERNTRSVVADKFGLNVLQIKISFCPLYKVSD
jgi:hypothetical protein